MNKQEFLDKIPESYEEMLTQELIRGLGKTQMTNLKRSIKLLMTLAYKTQYKELSLQQVSDCIDIADVYNLDDKPKE